MTEPLALIFKLNNGLVRSSLDGLSDDELWQRPASGSNPIGWLVGHLTETRAQLIAELGGHFDTGWPRMFSRGSTVQERSRNPTREQLEQAWNATRGALRDAFAALTPEQLEAAPSGSPFPGVKTRADQIAGLAFHESYHVGQIAYIRKLLGHSTHAG